MLDPKTRQEKGTSLSYPLALFGPQALHPGAELDPLLDSGGFGRGENKLLADEDVEELPAAVRGHHIVLVILGHLGEFLTEFGLGDAHRAHAG